MQIVVRRYDYSPTVLHAVLGLFALLVNLYWNISCIWQLLHAALSFPMLVLLLKVEILFSEIIVPFPCIHFICKYFKTVVHFLIPWNLCTHPLSLASLIRKLSSGLSTLKQISANVIFHQWNSIGFLSVFLIRCSVVTVLFWFSTWDLGSW